MANRESDSETSYHEKYHKIDQGFLGLKPNQFKISNLKNVGGLLGKLHAKVCTSADDFRAAACGDPRGTIILFCTNRAAVRSVTEL